MQVPCKDCPDRKLGCHSTCEKYIAFDKHRKELSAKRIEQNRLIEDIIHLHEKRKKNRRW